MMGSLLSNRKALSEKALGKKKFFQQCSIFCLQVEKETKFLNVRLHLAAF